jgi:hypothetical protein
MKNILMGLACFFTFEMQALEYNAVFENDQICIAKAIIQPHEEIGLHRDVYPQVVIALKGGTITRLESDGRETEVQFPTGVAVYRPTDPENELHRSVNNSSEPVELVIVHLKKKSGIVKADNQLHEIDLGIKIDCPMSEELESFMKTVPQNGDHPPSFNEWKDSFVSNMTQLIRLVESEKISNASWYVNIDAQAGLKNYERR